MTPFLPLALVTSAVAAPNFVVAALWVRLLSSRVFWLLYAGYWLVSFGQGTIHGLRGVCFLLDPPPNPAVKRDAALKRVAPYF